jgi:hypothetical protein
MAADPNQGATGEAPAVASASAGPDAAERDPINQGAAGSRPLGESPLSVESEHDAFAERPEAYVGAAFAGGLALALILRRFAR